MTEPQPPQRRRDPGEVIVWRSVVEESPGGQQAHVAAALPAIVVEESTEFVAIFQPVGTTIMNRTGSRGGPGERNMMPNGLDGGHAAREWTGEGVLRVHPRGKPWSVWRWLDADSIWSSHFYVNLETPWTDTPTGYDSEDWVLDIVVHLEPTGSGPGSESGLECGLESVPAYRIQYKDEDELEWCVSVGAISAEEAGRVRAAGREAWDAAASGAWPFRADWDRWLPEPHWPVPLLVENWNELAS